MLAILEFIFSSFWTWAGTTVLAAVISAGFGAGVETIRRG